MILPVFPIVSLSVAFLFALVTTSIARRFALAIGLMDNPDTHRKLHREPIAICGNIAILFSVLGTLVVCLMAYPAFVSISTGHMYEAMSLALEGEPGRSLGTRAIGWFCSQFDFTKWPKKQFVCVPDRYGRLPIDFNLFRTQSRKRLPRLIEIRS